MERAPPGTRIGIFMESCWIVALEIFKSHLDLMLNYKLLRGGKEKNEHQ